MKKIEHCIECNHKLTYYDNYNFDVFPIGRIFINRPCYICKNCFEFYCDEELSDMKYKLYDKRKDKLLKNKYDFEKNPELWMNIEELSEKIKFDKNFILRNKKFFTAGIYNIKIKDDFYFLRKSVDLYIKKDDGLFWLVNKNHKIKHNTCYWCGIGDKHNRDYHEEYDEKIGFFNVYFPVKTCTYCGCFCADDDYFNKKKETIEEIIRNNQ